MNRLNDILRELGISKVKLAQYLGVSRQMIYNYLELDSVNKWPKDKKLLLLNLLGVKNSEDIDSITVNTDYINQIDAKLNENTYSETDKSLLGSLNKKEKILMQDIINSMKDKIQTKEGYYTILYMFHMLQSLDSSKELKYILGYTSKALGLTNPNEFIFDEEQQYIFESIMFSASNLYNRGTASKSKIAASREQFLNHIEQKKEEKMSRTVEIISNKEKALKELNYTKVTDENLSEVLTKMAEIESRKVGS